MPCATENWPPWPPGGRRIPTKCRRIRPRLLGDGTVSRRLCMNDFSTPSYIRWYPWSYPSIYQPIAYTSTHLTVYLYIHPPYLPPLCIRWPPGPVPLYIHPPHRLLIHPPSLPSTIVHQVNRALDPTLPEFVRWSSHTHTYPCHTTNSSLQHTLLTHPCHTTHTHPTNTVTSPYDPPTHTPYPYTNNTTLWPSHTHPTHTLTTPPYDPPTHTHPTHTL